MGSSRKSVAALFMGLAFAGAALAQEWPAKPIRVVIPFAAGSVSEAVFRTASP